MAIKPMLDDLELQLVQQIEADERQVRAQHAVPALEGDFLQPLGRRAERITLNGILTEDDDKAVGEKLKGLREKFRAARPVPFAADIATATKIDTVLIEEMSVRELAGKPERFEYAFALREYIPAPPPEEEEPPPPPEPLVTTLIVEVIVEGQPNFDFSKVTVTVDGHKEDGSPHKVTLGQPAGNIWTEEGFPPGSYTAEAVVTDPPPMSGSRPVQVLEGQKTRVTIVLRPGSTRVIARAFVVHFRFDKAFIEPCMRKVLNEVAAYARGHEQEKMLIVGHTDKSGSDDYNYSLSDRRARSVFAYLNFGNDRAGSLREWNEMRRPSTHSLPSLRDNWGVRQYQYMLEDLGFLPGNVDGDHRDQTDAAVQAFRAARGLPPGTTVDDAVWEALIEDYHGQEPQAVKPDRLLQNANDTGCNGGPLKWLSCGEEMPLPSTPPSPCNPNPGTAWRPNRRTEILFVTETTLPCPVPEPVTFRLDPPGPVGTTWCLGPGNPARRGCFLTRDANDTTRWLVQPMEPGTITVTGSIRRPDGTGLANTSFVLIAPDGEFMNGEHLCDAARGTPNFGVTDANGNFDFSARSPTPVGIYTMEIKLPRGNHVAHLATEPASTGRGSIVCTRLDSGNSVFNVIVQDGTPASFAVRPSIAPATSVVVVKKASNNPARRQITLSADQMFTGTGRFERSSPAINFFTAANGGSPLAFDGTDNVFTGAQLVAGVQLFAEGVTPSLAVDDVTLTLTLSSAVSLVAPPATAAMTSVELTLDICVSRSLPGVDPAPLSTNDKINTGRFLQAHDLNLSHERALLIVRPPNPAAFAATLELTALDPAKVQLFSDEVPAAGQANLPDPRVIQSSLIPADGIRFFVEGVSASNLVRDAGYRLGIQGVENDCDRVAITVVQLQFIDRPVANAPAATFVRFGLWDDAFDPATGNLRHGVADPQDFIGSDSRRFYVRLRDPSRAGTTTIRWRTVLANNALDDPPAPRSQDITLTETGVGTGIFLSRALMLVTDDVDRGQATNSGLTAGDVGMRAPGQSNHRLRRMRIDDTHQLDGRVVAEYASSGAGLNPFIASSVMFNRAPEERLRMRIHFVNVRDRVGGAGVLTDARRRDEIRAFQEMYALCGIFVEIDEIVIDPPASATGWPGRFPGDPLAVDPSVEGFTFPGANLVASVSQTDLINVVRARADFSINDVYIIYVARILDSPLTTPLTAATLGQSFPDSFVAAGSPTRSFVFVGVRGATLNTDIHEVTHVTTDLRNAAGGHFYYGVIGPPGPGQFTAGNVDAKNLMFPIAFSGLGVRDPKRLWDIANPNNPMVNNNVGPPPMVIPSQIAGIRGSRFRRLF